MAESSSPTEVFHRLIDGVVGGRWDELPELYAQDTTVTHPFAMPEPTRLDGRERIRQHFAQAANLPFTIVAENVVVHETKDPELIVGEFDYRCTMNNSGRRFTISNIFVLRVRDGLIVESRDCHNHAEIAAQLAAN